MQIPNNTHRFNEFTKTYNVVPDSNLFSCESSRRMGYFQRIYFEHLYTQKVGGVSFFYTLTYNDKSIPKYLGRNCFSYDDIRYVTNGALSKYLKRHFGSRLRYFCACETGEGKGKRGVGNNPHYHFIFFVQPLHDKEDKPVYSSFKLISPQLFKQKILELWQGSSNVRFRDTKFGIARPGDFEGVIQSADAFSYVGKYVIKDASEKSFLDWLERFYYNEVVSKEFSPSTIFDYWEFNKADEPNLSFSDCISLFRFSDFIKWRHHNENLKWSYYDWVRYGNNDVLKVFVAHYDKWFSELYVPYYVDYKVAEYKNRFSAKVRCSKSLGIYGLNFIKDININPRISIPTSKGYQLQYPCLYYLRKLYYNVRICSVTGNPLYTLNDLGISLKLSLLPHRVESLINNTRSNVEYVLKNRCYIRFKDHIDSSKLFEDSLFYKKLFPLVHHQYYEKILRCYSVYKNVYEYRHFIHDFATLLDSDCKQEHYLLDYKYFISLDSFLFDFEYTNIYRVVQCSSKYRSFSELTPFKPYLEYFELLDMLNEFVSFSRSDSKRFQFVSKSEHQKRIHGLIANLTF